MQDKEIEIQLRMENSQNLKVFLENEATFVSENQQIDDYYVPAHRNFLDSQPIQEWFRIREEKGQFSANYKKRHDENGIGTYADEYETKIESKETFKKILNALDFKQIITVDKTRKKYNYKDYEIALDKVVGLGDFVEIEYKGKEIRDPKEITNEMFVFLKTFQTGKIENTNSGYPMMLLYPDINTFIEVK